MKKNQLATLVLLGSSFAASAGTMGPVATDSNQLMFEAGFNYMHTYLKDSFTPTESVTNQFPNGFAISPADYYPTNFYGGYIGLSYYTHQWLLNARYNMYATESKRNAMNGVFHSVSPVRLVFTADRVWGDVNYLSYGLGAGAAISNINDGRYINGPLAEPGNEGSQSLGGEGSRIDPVIEAFVMKRIATNFNMKFNAEYQIPVHDIRGNGDLVLSLGLNYAANV
ncbi:hypothetical protein [Legionella worsleiensis]|uniref:Outer membrane protein beta-barrel domain-containing protein n=1 Tax=Legionella worsleiensis TaxID=45076 RepID=A0A0W1AA93_9GAMM|nr:hypothetical protein [Legionella worsleiensis]KTD78003.1 hypothetical protein Lwor_1885 [Legionella worsleiensis]STY31510.1 Uncharacterised protein [Legionella worsleiensis]